MVISRNGTSLEEQQERAVEDKRQRVLEDPEERAMCVRFT